MIFLKVHNTENGDIIAMCDESLIDTVLTEGEITLDLKTYADFYKGDKLSESDIEGFEISNILSANVVGKESISIAIKNKIIEDSNVKMINKVPYAQAFKIK